MDFVAGGVPGQVVLPLVKGMEGSGFVPADTATADEQSRRNEGQSDKGGCCAEYFKQYFPTGFCHGSKARTTDEAILWPCTCWWRFPAGLAFAPGATLRFSVGGRPGARGAFSGDPAPGVELR